MWLSMNVALNAHYIIFDDEKMLKPCNQRSPR
jgi:hypothetical protein